MNQSDDDAALNEKFNARADNTFRPVWLNFDELAKEAPASLRDFAKQLRAALDERRKSRYGFYNGRRVQYAWVLSLQSALAWLGAAGIVLTAVATAAHFLWPDDNVDGGLLVTAMICYAVMAGISFYERSLNLAAAYFRSVGILLAMRDIWTRLQFELLAELRAATVGGTDVEVPARDRMAALAQAAWNDMEALTRGEQENWQGEVLSSLKDLATAAEGGRGTVESRLSQMEKDAAAAATARAERAAAAARAKAPALLTVTLSGDFAGRAEILIDEQPVAGTETAEVALKPRPLGPVHLSATAKDSAGIPLQAALNLELKPGMQTAMLALAPAAIDVTPQLNGT